MDRGGFEPPPPRFAHGITTTRLSAQNAFPFYLAIKFLLNQTMTQLMILLREYNFSDT